MTAPADITREAILAEIDELLASGAELTEDEMIKHLRRAKSALALVIERAAVSGKVVNRDVTRMFNSLQNAVERHELIHGPREKAEPDIQVITLSKQDRDERRARIFGGALKVVK